MPARLPLLTLAATLALLASPAQAAGNSATAMGLATAEVIAPITVTQSADLDFGVIVSSALASGTVLIAPGAGQSSGAQYGGGVSAGCDPSLGCPVPHPAQFTVAGEANRSYAIAAPSSISITGEALNAGQSTPPVLTVNGITLRSASRPADGPAGQLDANGHDSFSLGGTLAVPPAVAPARYRVTLQVIVTYI